MSSNRNTLTTPHALATLESVKTILRELGQASRQEIAEQLGMTDVQTGRYLDRLSETGIVARLAPARSFIGGRAPATWCLVGFEHVERSDWRRVVKAAKATNTGMRRDPLVAALFGPGLPA